MKRLLFATAALLPFQGVGFAVAQTIEAPPSHGVVALRGGFTPDPHEVRVRAGGPRYTGTALTGCSAGYIPDAPSVRLDWTAAGDAPLNISAQSEADTTLAVRAPDGSWLCNDDSPAGVNPELRIERPATGRYGVWVGRFGVADDPQDATLRFSAAAAAPAEPSIDAPAAQTPPPDPTLAPAQGSLTLRAGFTPDPATLPVQAGGSTDTSSIAGCNGGWVSQAPAVRLAYTAGSGPLVLSVSSQADTTLAVRAPDGRWMCNDDGPMSLDPQVVFESPASGVYDVFVGRFAAPGATAPATLRASGTIPPPPPEEPVEPEGAATPTAINRPPNPQLRPTYGALVLRTGFKPDPATVAVHAGGPLDATALGESCSGVIAEAPSVRVSFTAGPHPLSFSVRAAGDTILAVRGPDGAWSCNDDSEGMNPRVTFQRPRTGRYDVWVGVFGGGSNLPPAILRVSEMVDLTPPTPAER